MYRAMLFGAVILPMVFLNPVEAAFKRWVPSADLTTAPQTISATGFYTNIATQQVTSEAVYFEVNSALWSDHAKKKRWIILPAGQKITYNDTTDFYVYPAGTFFIKNFYHETVPGDASTQRIWETRILVNKTSESDATHQEWFGYSYRWKRNGSDADLVKGDAERDTLHFYPNGLGAASKVRKWEFPSSQNCNQCHVTGADYFDLKTRSVLGFFPAQQNMPAPLQPAINQLIYLFNKGVFNLQPDPAKAARWYAIDDESAPLDNRARAYIAANCSGCHGARGIENGLIEGQELNYDFHTGTPAMEFRDRYLTYDYGIDNSKLVVAGAPEKSIILHRQKLRKPDYVPSGLPFADDEENFDPLWSQQMPPLAVYEEDTTAVRFLTQWISGMEPLPASIHGHRAPSVFQKPVLQNRHLYLPADLVSKPGLAVQVVDVSGRKVAVEKMGEGVYRLAASLPRGLYLFKVGNLSFTHYIF